MTIFTRSLLVVTLFSCLFSCARREQALYQKSQREQFTRVSAPTATLTEVNQSALDSNQASAAPDSAASDMVASVRTDVGVSRSTPTWKSHPKVVQPVEKITVNQTETHQKKRPTRISILKRLVADPPVQTSGLAIASLVCGILSFLFLAVILGPLAIIFGAVAMSKIRKNPEIKGRGMAVAGLILGIVGTIVIIVYLASRSS